MRLGRDMSIADFKLAWTFKHQFLMVLATLLACLLFYCYVFESIHLQWLIILIGFLGFVVVRDTLNYNRSQSWEDQPDGVQLELLKILRSFYLVPGMRSLLLRWAAEQRNQEL